MDRGSYLVQPVVEAITRVEQVPPHFDIDRMGQMIVNLYSKIQQRDGILDALAPVLLMGCAAAYDAGETNLNDMAKEFEKGGRTQTYAAKVIGRFMQDKLNLNGWKGGWSHEEYDWLRKRLVEEILELYRAIDAGWGVLSEVADVANFGAFLAERTGEIERG